MILKLIVAAALVAAPVPASAPIALADPIPLVVCPVTGGVSMGTAFRISPHLLLSVKHVTNFPNCLVDGRKVKVVYTSPSQDFSILSDDRVGPFLRVDCGGFVTGGHYIAIGHARGLDQLTSIDLIATGITRGGFYALRGVFTVIPGQSGGAILDAETGKVVGTINVYDMPSGLSGSVELKDTSVCQH